MATPLWPQDQDAEAEAEKLAKAAQDPIASIYSLPLQSNTNFGIGLHGRTEEVLNIQPVIPINAGPLNLINRSIAPVMYQPHTGEASGGTIGFGDLNHTVFLSPAKASTVTWGVGPSITLPTATDNALGTGKWSLGPSFIVVATPGRLVAGALVNNVWSFAGDSERQDVNSMLLQYFINYNLPKGWYLVTSPILTSNWKAEKGNRWFVPFGGGLGRLFKIGK